MAVAALSPSSLRPAALIWVIRPSRQAISASRDMSSAMRSAGAWADCGLFQRNQKRMTAKVAKAAAMTVIESAMIRSNIAGWDPIAPI